MHQGASPQIFSNAQALRLKPTKAEEMLWEYLKDRKNGRSKIPETASVTSFYT